jgi:hypothetical protein
MFNDEQSFYSLIDNRFWIHNSKGYQRYYGQDKDFILDTVFTQPPGQPKVWDNLSIVANVQKYDPNVGSFVDTKDKIFYKGIFYSANQCSGEQQLVIKENSFMNNLRLTSNQVAIQKVDNRWQLSEIRDYVVDTSTPIFSSA